MKKVKVRLATLGSKKHFDGIEAIARSRSQIIDFYPTISSHQFRCVPDEDWGYSTEAISGFAPQRTDEDVLVILASFPIEDNYILKRIGDCRVIVTSFDVGEILSRDRISFSNLVLRYCYATALMRLSRRDVLVPTSDWHEYSHADTRGCLFDMTPYKTDISVSCDGPIICQECRERLSGDGISDDCIDIAAREISRKIRKKLYWRIVGFAEKHPLFAFGIATSWALLVGATASIIASAVIAGG